MITIGRIGRKVPSKECNSVDAKPSKLPKLLPGRRRLLSGMKRVGTNRKATVVLLRIRRREETVGGGRRGRILKPGVGYQFGAIIGHGAL